MKSCAVRFLILCLVTVAVGCSKGTNGANVSGLLDSDAAENGLESTPQDVSEAVPASVTEDTEDEPEPSAVPVVYTADSAALYGKTRIENTVSGFTGNGYITGFENDGDYCEFTVHMDASGFYDLNFVTSSGKNGYKENYVLVNGENMGTVSAEGESFQDSVIKRVYLEQGESVVRYLKYWGWVYLDRLEVVPSEPLGGEIFDISPELVNKNASEETRKLMEYLTEIYGDYILTGQYCDLGLNGFELFTINREVGKRPAVLGLDMMDYTPSRVASGTEGKAVERAVEFDEAGGIVTMCWHWNAPEDYLTGTWYRGFYKEETDIDLAKIMNGQDETGYNLLLRDIDAVSEQLKRLQDADVPVLWRPLHEASGGWFWWGAAGAEACIDLWKLLYERMTEHHGLNNLIWVWNGQSADWYPGDEYVDIIGEDIYAGERVYSSQIGKFMEILEYSGGKKMIVMSENGTLIDPDLAVRDGAMWGFFATWGGDFVLRGQGMTRLSEKYSERSMLEKVYNHEKTLTLDELPDWKNR